MPPLLGVVVLAVAGVYVIVSKFGGVIRRRFAATLSRDRDARVGTADRFFRLLSGGHLSGYDQRQTQGLRFLLPARY
jgi:hypothetical protein